MFDVVMLITWLIIGALNLCSPEPIGKFSYFLVWVVVIVHFVSNVVT